MPEIPRQLAQQSVAAAMSTAPTLKRKRPTSWTRGIVAVASTSAMLWTPGAPAAVDAVLATANTAIASLAFQLPNISSGSCGLTSWPTADAATHYAAVVAPRRSWSACGRCAKVWCTDTRCATNKTSTVAYVVDDNSTADNNTTASVWDIRLAPRAFLEIAGQLNGSVAVEWQLIDCPTPTNTNETALVSICASVTSNNTWLALQPVNDTVGVTSISVNHIKAKRAAPGRSKYSVLDPNATYTQTPVLLSITTRREKTFLLRIKLSPGKCVTVVASDQVIVDGDTSGSSSGPSSTDNTDEETAPANGDDENNSNNSPGSSDTGTSSSQGSEASSSSPSSSSDSGSAGVFDPSADSSGSVDVSPSAVPSLPPPTRPSSTSTTSTRPTLQPVPSTSRVSSPPSPSPPANKNTRNPPTQTLTRPPPQDPNTDTNPPTTAPASLPPTIPTIIPPRPINSSIPPPRPTRNTGIPPEIVTRNTMFTSPVFIGILLGTVGLVGAVVTYRAKMRQQQLLERAPMTTASAHTSRTAYAPGIGAL